MVKPQGVRPNPARRAEEHLNDSMRGLAVVPTPVPAISYEYDGEYDEEDAELELPQKGDNVLVTVRYVAVVTDQTKLKIRIRPPNRSEAHDHEPWTYLPDGQSVQLGTGRDKKDWTFGRSIPCFTNVRPYPRA